MRDVYLGLGSNLGDKHANVARALDLLGQDCKIVDVSSLFSTEPLGSPDQDWFINCALKIDTDLAPQQLLAVAQSVERRLKRVRTIKDGPRTIDIDILFYGGWVVNESGLTIPHPRLHQRLFALAPLNEICPDFVHPVLKHSVREMARRLEGKQVVERLTRDRTPRQRLSANFPLTNPHEIPGKG